MPSIRSSTAEQYASSSLDTAILHLLSSAGFVRSSSNATHVLTEVLQRYFRLLAAHSAAYAEHAGRTEIAPLDLLRTLEEVGTSVEEVKQWAVEGDGKEVAWAPKDSSGAEVLGQNGKDLRPLLAHGRRPPEKGSALPLYYTAVSPDERDSLVLQRASEDRWLLPFESEEETDDECEHRTPTPTENEGDIKDRTSPSRLHSAESPSTSGSPSTSFVPISDGNIHNKPKRRKTSHSRYPDGFSKHTQFDYVPTHLPPLPGVEICEQPLRGTESTQATDAEYARERALYGSAQKKMRAEAEGPEVSSTLPELVTTQSRRVLRNVWREAIPYTDSMLGEVQPASDVPTLHEATSATSLQAFATTNSSLRAFAASYGTLQEDPTSSAGAGLFLTPAGNAHADVAAKRRRLAAAIADPNRYHPSDTLYGAVAVRPSSVPFIPGPSLLITTSATSAAPVFTPVRPHGRPVALIPPAGALVPALGYRHPAHIAAVSRLVAPPDLLRRVARAGDPPPLYDDKHAERVFQGAPAPRELLNGGYSALAPALAELARSTAPSVPNNDDGQEREDDRKPSAGTLVHTWDWHVRDYVDAALPGRRLRA